MDARTLIHGYIIPNAGPIATVFAATVAAGVAITFGITQARIAKQQAKTAVMGVDNAFKLGQLQLKIAEQQAETAKVSAKTARNKLRLDLFKERLAMHDVIEEWISAVPAQPFGSPHFSEFLKNTSRLKWLFPEEVSTWVYGELYEQAREIAMLKAGLEGVPAGAHRAEKIIALSDHISNFVKMHERLHDTFAPYLSLED
jgi:hypothetical protein